MQAALEDRLVRYHRTLAEHEDGSGYMVVHGTAVERGHSGAALPTPPLTLEDVEKHADRLDTEYGDWPVEGTEYPTI